MMVVSVCAGLHEVLGWEVVWFHGWMGDKTRERNRGFKALED